MVPASIGVLGLTLAYAVFRSGGVEPQDWGVCLLALGLLSALYWTGGRRGRGGLSRLWLLAALIGLAGLQIVPLPVAVLRLVSPARAELVAASEPVLGAGRFATLSATPVASQEMLLGLLGCALVFLLVADLSSRLADHPWAAVLPLFAIALLEAVLGLVQAYAPGGDRIARGTYVNRNHFSGLLEMCLPFVVMYGVAIVRRNRSRRRTPARPALLASAVFGCGAVVLLAIIQSLSRMGFVAVLTSLLLMGLVAIGAGKARSWSRWAPAGLLAVVVLLAFVFLPTDQLIRRFGDLASTEEISGDTRVQMWGDTTRLISAYPLLGCGLGAFESCLMRYNSLGAFYTVDAAHNDYLQVAAELGLPGLLLLLVLAGVVLASAWRGASQGGWSEERWRAAACLGALGAILLHSFVDFNLYIPANAMTVAWVGGLAQSRGRAY